MNASIVCCFFSGRFFSRVGTERRKFEHFKYAFPYPQFFFMRNNYNEKFLKFNIYTCDSRTILWLSFFFLFIHKYDDDGASQFESFFISDSLHCYFNDLFLCMMSHFE